MRFGIPNNMPYQIVDQVGIKIQTSLKKVKNQTRFGECLSQDVKASSVNKMSLPNLPILLLKEIKCYFCILAHILRNIESILVKYNVFCPEKL